MSETRAEKLERYRLSLLSRIREFVGPDDFDFAEARETASIDELEDYVRRFARERANPQPRSKKCRDGFHDFEPATGLCRRTGCDAFHHAGQGRLFGADLDDVAVAEAKRRIARTGQGEMFTNPARKKTRRNRLEWSEIGGSDSAASEARFGSGLSGKNANRMLQVIARDFEGGRAFTAKELANESGMSETSARAALATLKRAGYVSEADRLLTQRGAKGAQRWTGTRVAEERAQAQRDVDAELEGEALLERQIAQREAEDWDARLEEQIAEFEALERARRGRTKPGQGKTYRPVIHRKGTPGHKLPPRMLRRIRALGYRVNPVEMLTPKEARRAMKQAERLVAECRKGCSPGYERKLVGRAEQVVLTVARFADLATVKKNRKRLAAILRAARAARKRLGETMARKKKTSAKRSGKKTSAKRSGKRSGKKTSAKKHARKAKKPAAKKKRAKKAKKKGGRLARVFHALWAKGLRGKALVKAALKRAGLARTNPLRPREVRHLLAMRKGFKAASEVAHRVAIERKRIYGDRSGPEGSARAAFEEAAFWDGAALGIERVVSVVRKTARRRDQKLAGLVARTNRNPLTEKQEAVWLKIARNHLGWGEAVRQNVKRRLFHAAVAQGVAQVIYESATSKRVKRLANAITERAGRMASVLVSATAESLAIFDAKKRLEARGDLSWRREKRRERRTAAKKGTGKKNPGHMLAVTTLVNPTLTDSMERWARAHGLQVPGRGSAGYKALYTVWVKHGMPNPRRAGKKTSAERSGQKTSAKRSGQKTSAKKKRKKTRTTTKTVTTTRTTTKKRKARKTSAKGLRRVKRYGDLPAWAKKKYRPAAAMAARRLGCKLEDVPIKGWAKTPAPAPHGLVYQGELLEIKYGCATSKKTKGRSPFAGSRWRHASGDRGRGKKKGRRQTVAVDPKTKKWLPVELRGASASYDPRRGLIG